MRPFTIILIQIYTLTRTAAKDEVDEFYNALAKTLISLTKTRNQTGALKDIDAKKRTYIQKEAVIK